VAMSTGCTEAIRRRFAQYHRRDRKQPRLAGGGGDGAGPACQRPDGGHRDSTADGRCVEGADGRFATRQTWWLSTVVLCRWNAGAGRAGRAGLTDVWRLSGLAKAHGRVWVRATGFPIIRRAHE